MSVFDSKSFHKACAARTPHVDVACEELGGTVRIGRLNAAKSVAIGKHYKNVPKDKDGQPVSDEAITDFYVLLLAMSIIDESGDAFLLNDEGKHQLAGLSLGTLVKLGNEAMVLNGMADTKSDPQKKLSRAGTSKTPKTP